MANKVSKPCDNSKTFVCHIKSKRFTPNNSTTLAITGPVDRTVLKFQFLILLINFNQTFHALHEYKAFTHFVVVGITKISLFCIV